MWAQLISARLTAGREDDFELLVDHLREAEQPGSGLLRSLAMRDQQDPAQVHMLVVFVDEAAARAREQDPRRGEGLAAARALMAEIFDGPPSFTDLDVVAETVPEG